MSSQKLKKRNNRLVLIPLLIILSFTIGYYVKAQTELSFSTIIENGSMVETASYIIFKDGSTYYARNGTTGSIDYSGIIASTLIKNVISNCSNGDKIYFKKGTYVLTDPDSDNVAINITKPLILEFEGGVTFSVSSNIWAIVVYKCPVVITGFPTITGTSTLDAFYMRGGYASGSVISRSWVELRIRGTWRYGMLITGYTYNAVFLPDIYGTFDNGIRMDQEAGWSEPYPNANTFLQAFVNNNKPTGKCCINIADSHIAGNTFISPNVGYGCDYGFIIAGTDNAIYNGWIEGVTTGITFSGSSARNRVWGGVITGVTTVIVDSGSNNRIVECEPYKNTNRGTVSVDNGDLIPHLLSHTPNLVLVTCKTPYYGSPPMPVIVTVTSYDATNFQVNVYWTNGTVISSGTPISIDWYAEYKP